MYALATPSIGRMKSDREQDGLHGPVRSLRLELDRVSKVAGLFAVKRVLVRFACYDADGRKIEEVNYNSGGSEEQRELYSYDEAGRKLERILRCGSTIVKTTYSYAGNRIQALEHVKLGNRTSTREYGYVVDERGYQTEASYCDESFGEVKAFYDYSHDEGGRLATVTTRNAGGVVYHKLLYSYDANGKMATETAYGPDGTVYKRAIYRAGGRIKEECTHEADRSLRVKLVFTLDDNGSIVEVNSYNEAGELNSLKTVRSYKYDLFGNWIKETISSVDVATSKPAATWINYRLLVYQ